MIERGHKLIVDAFSKMSEGGSTNLVWSLPSVPLADQSTLLTSTSFTPRYIRCTSDPVLLIELKISTWQILPWDEVHSTADLLAIRAHQLQHRDKDLEEATLHFQRMRFEEKERHDLKHSILQEKLAIGSTVLLYDTRREKDMFWKSSFKWLKPYRTAMQ